MVVKNIGSLTKGIILGDSSITLHKNECEGSKALREYSVGFSFIKCWDWSQKCGV
ncbi:hypothetical protein ACTGZ3_11290 [Clostridioides difficile]|uniref:hypothetical protein n=1 Tax=Clostridioides difficile TaxID=1496 RepID=UPI0021C966C7|nr:hypothetical protein [Clostridioides difficile]UUV09568.1 hypothetical protein NQ182_14745 [Clostridioides difficile]HCU2974957.1 hypothetical protein [Clostridioides difficile]HCU3024510.1 hypothetical protein [Clostridioides difficile]